MKATSIAVVDSKILVRADYALKDRLKALPGARWSAADRAWVYPART